MVSSKEQSFRHRPTFITPNKKFKSRHSTKGQLKAKTKGKVQKDDQLPPSKHHKELSKADRRNATKILQEKKRNQVIRAQRLYSGLNGMPKVVAVVPLCSDVGSRTIVDALYDSMGQKPPQSTCGILTLERFKQKLHLIAVPRNLYTILDSCLAADLILFGLSAEKEVDDFGILTMSCIKTQGVTPTLACVQHLESLSSNKQIEARKSLTMFMNHHFPGDDHKVCSIGNDGEVLNLARFLSDKSVKGIAWRDKYSRIVAEEVDYDESSKCMRVTGYVRGMSLSANRLVYVSGSGAHQVKQITSSPANSRNYRNLNETDVLDVPDSILQENLVAVNEPDPMSAEQTWPTEDEILDAEMRLTGMSSVGSINGSAFSNPKRKKVRVPKGTSEYQAAWIVDSDDDETDSAATNMNPLNTNNDSENNSDERSRVMMEEDYEGQVPEDAAHDNHPIWMGREAIVDETENYSDEYEDLDLLSESGSHLPTRVDGDDNIEASKAKAAHEDLEFPDEVDTPRNVDARVRFQKYRGLNSFRTSPWDPYESLPIDYERIFQFKDFRKTKCKSLKMGLSGNVSVGTRVTVWIDGVSKDAYGQQNSEIVTIFSLLPHEQKFSVIHFALTRPSSNEGREDGNENTHFVVKSKDPMILFSGFRRYLAQPTYSTDTRGGSNNVHKFERYLQYGRTSVGSIYGPVTYGPGPIMMFKADGSYIWTDGSLPSLVATGALLDPDPTRIIAKRIILTGHPFKIHKKSAVIRYMFYTPADIAWFKPIQLYTKFGRVGHIKESLGTKGHMKCIFDGSLKHHDTVCMALYKRVFPRWGLEMYSPVSSHNVSQISQFCYRDCISSASTRST